MDIQVISKSCIKIILAKEEADSFEISFESFEKDNSGVKTFLGYILAVMGDVGIITSPYDKISVEVFEQSNMDLIIYISSSPYTSSTKKNYYSSMICCRDPIEIIDFLDEQKFSFLIIKETAKLYLYNDIYCLTFSARNNTAISENIISDEASIAKIKEYGRLICNTPFETLI